MKKSCSKKYQVLCRIQTLKASEIAKEVGVSPSYVYRVMRETRKFCEERKEDLCNLPILSIPNYIKLHNKFSTEDELAKYFGVSRSTLHRFKVKHNIARLTKLYYALFSRGESEQISLYKIASDLMQVDAILSLCEPDAIELPAVKLLLDTIRKSPYLLD